MQQHTTQRDYWLCQLAGWGGIGAVGLLSSSQSDPDEALRFAVAKTFCMATGFGLSHLWRRYLKRRSWLTGAALPFGRLLAGLLVLALLQTGFLLLADILFRGGALLSDPDTGVVDY